MKTRADYEGAIKVVGSVIDAWDPYCLLEGGSPPDERTDRRAFNF
jgi:hypothetical protein